MKKIYRHFCCFVAAATVLPLLSAAQEDQALAKGPAIHPEVIQYMKSGNPGKTTGLAKATNISTKAKRSFTQLFGDGLEVSWYALGKDYLALFRQDDQHVRALFEPNGYLRYSVSYGLEKDLPRQVRQLIRSNYGDYQIGRVAKVTAESQSVWLTNLQNDSSLVILRADERNFDEFQRFDTEPAPKRKKARIINPPALQ